MQERDDETRAEVSLPWAEWLLMEPMDSGSSGTVYRACRKEDPTVQCAVKIISIPSEPEQLQAYREKGYPEEQIHAMLKREAEACLERAQRFRSLSSSTHIVSMDDAAMLPDAEGPGFTVLIRMELLTPLNAWLSGAPAAEEDILRLGLDLCDALETCHGAGILHTDIKPDNLFADLTRGGKPIFKLGDFGTALRSKDETGTFMPRGTPLYMAPETVSRQEYSVRSDLYMAGLTLYKLMNRGRLPFMPEHQFATHEDYARAIQMRLSGMAFPPPMDASRAMARIILKACAFQLEDRYGSAAEMKVALNRLRRKAERSFPIARFGVPLLCAALLFTLCLAVSGREVLHPAPSDPTRMPGSATADSLSVNLGLLNDQLEINAMFPKEKVNFRFPTSVDAFRSLCDLPDLLPVLSMRETAPDLLFLSPSSPEWSVWLEYPEEKIVSLLWDAEAEGYRMVSTKKSIQAASALHLEHTLLLDKACRIMISFDPESLIMNQYTIDVTDEPRKCTVSITTGMNGVSFMGFSIRSFQQGQPGAQAKYDSAGQLKEVYYAGKTWPYPDSSLPIIGVDLFQ